MSTPMTESVPASGVRERLDAVRIQPSCSITDALAHLDRAGSGVLLVTDGEDRLLGVLTDGDFRRAVLAGTPLGEPCLDIATTDPVVGSAALTAAEALYLMDHGREYTLDHLPLVDDDGRVVGLVLRSDFVAEAPSGADAVIMAGGFGTRLMPLTRSTPKPMLPLGGRPLLERTIECLREAGVRHVNITTHYLGGQIASHFGDGHDFGVELKYLTEERPLGTAGGLRLIDPGGGPLLVINGDIVTGLHFRDLLAYHRIQRADLTIAVRQYEMQVPYGVVECAGERVSAIREKPVHRFFVNAGIYVIGPAARAMLPPIERLDMPDLITHLLQLGRRVVSFPVMEYWLDVGRHDDYQRAQDDARNGTIGR
jgi:dTDP-glucose pyrophosphorylase/CBS domain-containing protein